MRVFHGFSEQLDVPAIVVQMDQITWELRSAWEAANSKWAVLFTQQQADAAEARLKSLRALITDLDVGGVARSNVFFPQPGQTSEEAWDTYRETANYVRAGLAQLGQFISNWSLSTVLPRIGKDVKDTVTGGTALLAAGVGLALVLSLTANARRAYSGYRRRRR